MGEKKRRIDALAAAPCICGSNRPAVQCCFEGKVWHKAPAVLGLKALPRGSSIDKCYMKELGSCEGGLSAEHLISESICKLLAEDGEFTISGLPWIPGGETISVGTKNLAAKCLCRKHNSALHPLDDAALYFVRSLKTCFEVETPPSRFIVSGHDIERWLLKTIKALAVSKNLAQGGNRLSGSFASDIRVIDMLDEYRLGRKILDYTACTKKATLPKIISAFKLLHLPAMRANYAR